MVNINAGNQFWVKNIKFDLKWYWRVERLPLVVPVPEDRVDGAPRDGAGQEDGAALQDGQAPLTAAGEGGPGQEEPPD